MRVLWWTYDFWPSIGGGEVLGAELILGLKARGHDLAVVTREADGSFSNGGAFHGIPIERFPFHAVLEAKDAAEIVALQSRIKDRIREFRPDLVHLHTLGYSSFFCERAIPDLPTRLLVTRHELFPGPFGRDTVTGRLLARADWIACCSRAVLDQLLLIAPEARARASAILNGLAPPREAPSPLSLEPPVLLCLGRLTEQKGFDLAIAALARLSARFPDIRMVIAGDGPARPALEDAAARLGVTDLVFFSGWLAPARVTQAIDAASVVLVPSRGVEAFGLVALQAAQMGRPVVATSVGGLPEVVQDGTTGLVCDPESAAALADAIAWLLERPETAARFGRVARERALGAFTGERYLDDYDDLYHRLAACAS